ncbi:hypothetical protein QYE76_064711 [Lolium multiflorum]|uniref:RNase H type-1 domain-containing protein n=1 Tax=Lolium multiflorum TaxID=4521 RepID=A0AAD8W7Z7_LOLMU|nr:hypothetical protein QYE76_064711 [Lolium multiflorum]
MAAKKLKHYFQSIPSGGCHSALAEIIGSKDANGRVAKWALELAAHTILYEPRTAIKSQILADFFVDWAEMQYRRARLHALEAALRRLEDAQRLGSRHRHHLSQGGSAGLCPADPLRRIEQCGGQASGDWDAKDANMASYRFHVQQLSGFFDGCEFHHVPRANNEAADALSKIGSTRQAIPPGVALAILKKPSITPSPDSDSIFVPADRGLLGHPGASLPKSGAHQPNPPASQPNPGAYRSNAGLISQTRGLISQTRRLHSEPGDHAVETGSSEDGGLGG